MNKSKFPLDKTVLNNIIKDHEVDLNNIGIRELKRLVDNLADQYKVDFLHFEFGVPGIPADRLGPEEEIRVLTEDKKLPSTYPPFDGIPRLKKATADFVKAFINIDVEPENCIPTVGAMHGGFIAQAIAGRRFKKADTILYLDPGFPVNKLQTKFLGLKYASIDLYDYRGKILAKKLEKKLSTRKIGSVLWSSPNNPTWLCLKDEELKMIGGLLTKYDVVGIEDSAYFGMDFRFDYGVPHKPPFQPTVANYTDNYIIIISSSKMFSYAGQRIAVAIVSPKLAKKKYSNLKKYYDTKSFGHAFVHGGIYPTTAGVPQSPQHALSALFEATCQGKYDYLSKVRTYGKRANEAKKIFLNNGFELLYNKDVEEPIADGFYFTIKRKDMTGGELLHIMLLFGISGIPMRPTGTKREGIRICVSLVQQEQYGELEKRVKALNNYLTISG
ncbi:pyridoxal phosphate-dependent aminotransferase [bacterium]|nr:pyridoxal phosphate-dependent aminotransferase [bacterium]